MTKLLYHTDAYLKEYRTRVTKIDENRVMLQETIFFPQTANEPGDLGKINDCMIIGLKKEGDEIWHNLNKSPSFKEGDEVILQLDWSKRYQMMRLHSALHLLAGVFDLQFKERAVAGVVKSDSAYLVFKKVLGDDIIEQSFSRANKDIRDGLEINTYEDENRQGFRWCKIGDYIPIPCGGVHIKNTNEIRSLILKNKLMDGERQKLVFELK